MNQTKALRPNYHQEEVKITYSSPKTSICNATCSGMSLTKPGYQATRTEGEIKSKSEISLPPFLEVTHLNKVTRVVPSEWHSQSLLENVLGIVSNSDSQMVQHYSIRMQRLSGVFLLDAVSGSMVWSSADLKPGKPYFLAFSKKEDQIDRESWETLGEEGVIPLKGKQLFWRESRSFVVKKVKHYEQGFVQDLHLHQSCGNPKGFRCPVMQCGNHFKKSCDLVIHFNVETGSNPYRCGICGQGFRRNILLKTHLTHKRCPILRHKRSLQDKRNKLPFSQVSPQITKPQSLLVPRSSTDPLVNSSTLLSPMNSQYRYQDPILNTAVGDQAKLSLQISQIVKNYSSLMLLINKLSENKSMAQIKEARLKICLQLIATIRLLA